MRRIRYLVTASLDGYIAGPRGEADWIVPDPGFDFSALFSQFDTVLLGRRTYEITLSPGGRRRGRRGSGCTSFHGRCGRAITRA